MFIVALSRRKITKSSDEKTKTEDKNENYQFRELQFLSTNSRYLERSVGDLHVDQHMTSI